MDWDGLVSQTTKFYSWRSLKKSGHVIFYSRRTCSSDEIVAFICCTAVILYILILDKLAFNRWRILYDNILTHTVMRAFYVITRNMLPIVDRVERCVYWKLPWWGRRKKQEPQSTENASERCMHSTYGTDLLGHHFQPASTYPACSPVGQ